MFPSETSLIPVTVALARFIEGEGITSALGIYPYWYLGTPYRYLTGPIFPLLAVGFHKLISTVTLFDITIYIIVFSFLASALGWILLVKKLSGNRIRDTVYFLLFAFLLIFPWRYFYSLALGEASLTLARNLLPWALLTFWNSILSPKPSDSTKAYLLPVLSLTLLLLINTSILPIFLVGLASLLLAKSFKGEKFKGIISNLKKALLLSLYSLLLATLWYMPGYWWTVLTNPSIGGASGFRVIIRIFDLLRGSVPLILAVGAVYFSRRIKTRLSVFTLIWILTFGFLTLFRFIGDPDFWMDWTTWLSELEIGLALLVSLKVVNLLKARKSQILNLKSQTNTKLQIPKSKQFSIGHLALVIFLFIIPFYLTWRFHLALGKPSLINPKPPEVVQSLQKLQEIAGDKRVFLSGSTVFWANALYDIRQVRGGNDKAAVHPTWHHGAYQLREGKDSALALKWLEGLDTSYVLVHTSNSKEYYHDFRNISKWNKVGRIVWEEQGDFIVEVNK